MRSLMMDLLRFLIYGSHTKNIRVTTGPIGQAFPLIHFSLLHVNW